MPLANKERLEKFSKVGVDRPMALELPAIVVVGGIPDCCSNEKCPSSNVDIGCVGYANGSSDGNMMGIRSGTLLKLANC